METEFLAKKKTLLSLSKLAALAADDPPEDLGLNLQGTLLRHKSSSCVKLNGRNSASSKKGVWLD